MNASRPMRFRFSLLALLIVVTLAGVIAGWLGRANEQRGAVLALRALNEYEDVVCYSFDGEGPCARVVGPEHEHSWIAQTLGIDLFYNATNICIHAERVEEAMPHLRRLSNLREIYVSADPDDPSSNGAIKAARFNAAIDRLRRELPKVNVEEDPGCPITTAKIPVVG